VRDGELKFNAGDETVHLEAGDSLFVPRNLPHVFVKTTEEYVRTASQFTGQSREERQKSAEKHGMRLVGPALTAD
jgi:mannose-6-phosphate isomerase-like protein (cupin superfamily)